MFERNKDAWLRSGIPIIDENSPALEKVSMTFKRQVDGRIEQRMTWTYERRQRLSNWRNQVFLESDALIASQHGFPRADLAITVAHRGWNVRYLITTRLSLPDISAQALERFTEE
jgi:hypothetical protein